MNVKRRLWLLFTLMAASGFAGSLPDSLVKTNINVAVYDPIAAGDAVPFGETPAEARVRVERTRAKAEKGDAESQWSLANYYSKGIGVTQDDTEALKWYRRAAENGNTDAQKDLGLIYARGLGVDVDCVEAARWFRKAADQGNVEAQFWLGDAYQFGRGVAQDDQEAIKWFRKAAEGGEASAQTARGICYSSGMGVRRDHAEAAKWYRRAAEQGDKNGQFDLGTSYVFGWGVSVDYAEAVKWFRKAADQGDDSAQYALGVSYEQGNGITRDYLEAAKLFRKAAEQNKAEAQYALGRCYLNGRGLTKDEAEAVKWFRKAAEQNDALAQYVLSTCYSSGSGVAKDYVEAYKWCLLAAGQGYRDGKMGALVLEGMMTRGQIAEGQKLARDFKPRKTPPPGSGGSIADIMQSRPESSGTGFFMTEDGYLITNEHVVKDSAQVRLVTATGLISAKIVKVDAANDLALLKAQGKFTALAVASSRTVKMGNTVATVGFPNISIQGFAPKMAKGEIAALSGAQDDARYFQISLPLQPGNSGGPLVDERGNVVGVVCAKLDSAAVLAATGTLPENVNYAVKSSFLLGFLESVPEVSSKLKEPNTKDRKFEDVVKEAEQASVLVLVY